MYRADGPAEMRPVGEVEFVQGLAAASASGLYGTARAAAAIIGHANLNLGERVAPVLEALQAASPNRFRGIRHSVTWDPHPEVENTAAHKMQGQLASDQFRAGARVLARMGMTLEGWLYHPQLPEMAAFARAVPELTIVLNHVGGLLRTGPYANRNEEVMANWKNGIAAVAACPNVVIKLGGLGMTRCGFDWHTRAKPIGSEELAASMAPFLSYCIEKFTPARSHVREQLPGRQGIVLVQRDVERVQAFLEGLFGQRARGDVPRHGGEGLSHSKLKAATRNRRRTPEEWTRSAGWLRRDWHDE